MKLTTFIKAYKIVLSDIDKKVKDWNRVFVTDVSHEDKTLKIVFSNSAIMEPGAIAMRTAVNLSMVEQIKSGLIKLSIADDYANAINEINDVGKFITVLDFVLLQTAKMVKDIDNDVDVYDVYFDLEKNFAIFNLAIHDNGELIDLTIHTDGKIAMFSNYAKE